MKKIVILFALALLCGCSGANSEFIRCSDQDLTCAELITETVLFSDLEHAAKTENTIDFERSSQGVSEVQVSGTLEVSDFEIIKVGTQVAEAGPKRRLYIYVCQLVRLPSVFVSLHEGRV